MLRLIIKDIKGMNIRKMLMNGQEKKTFKEFKITDLQTFNRDKFIKYMQYLSYEQLGEKKNIYFFIINCTT